MQSKIILFLMIFFSQNNFAQLSLIDSIFNNTVDIKDAKKRLLFENELNFDELKKNQTSKLLEVGCDSGTEIIGKINNDEIHIYNFQSDTSTYLGPAFPFGSASIGYLPMDESRIVAGGNWDSVYYLVDSTWIYSGFYDVTNEHDLISVGCGNKSTYFLGGHLWYFNGQEHPKKIRENIFYTCADLVVDENENAWILTGSSWPVSDTLRIIDSTGTSICDIPFKTPINTINAYGMTIWDGKPVVGFGNGNWSFPNSLVPLEFNETDNTVEFGEPILTDFNFTLDLASCDKYIEMPVCSVVNSVETNKHKKISFYPNPFNDIINFNSSINGEIGIEIFDVLGNKIEKYIFQQSNIELNTQNLSNGVYIFLVKYNGGIENFKLVKNY